MERLSYLGKLCVRGGKWRHPPTSNKEESAELESKSESGSESKPQGSQYKHTLGSQHSTELQNKMEICSEEDDGGLYHNSDPLFQLIGKVNESEVFADDQKCMVLIDSRAMMSTITVSLVK